ncbi:MaoC family dehydratase N-terminal domain-containing protein [Streptomyces sp. NPDC090088]|uniref:MaoC family dehydratase N-terminal domain-containing protein n=1 Tax=Streptomyces sp. NPDC090088 TaxID=3365944 RepID=UPI00383089D9
MALDPAKVGMEMPGRRLLITRSRLRQFAKATGQTDPVYLDPQAAKSAGHRDLPVPPTFFFSVDLEAPDPLDYCQLLGIDPNRILHGEQSFQYLHMAYAGDVLSTKSTVTDLYSRKGGALDFVTRVFDVVNQDNVLVASMESTVVVRNPADADRAHAELPS